MLGDGSEGQSSCPVAGDDLETLLLLINSHLLCLICLQQVTQLLQIISTTLCSRSIVNSHKNLDQTIYFGLIVRSVVFGAILLLVILEKTADTVANLVCNVVSRWQCLLIN